MPDYLTSLLWKEKQHLSENLYLESHYSRFFGRGHSMIVAVFLENQMESLFPLTTERDDYVLLDLQAISVNPVLSIDY